MRIFVFLVSMLAASGAVAAHSYTFRWSLTKVPDNLESVLVDGTCGIWAVDVSPGNNPIDVKFEGYKAPVHLQAEENAIRTTRSVKVTMSSEYAASRGTYTLVAVMKDCPKKGQYP